MRELNHSEVEAVSGGWVLSDIGSGLGYIIGSIVDLGASAGGLSTSAITASTQLGGGIGKILELNLSGAVSDIGKGVVGLVQYAIDSVNSLNGAS